MKAFVNRHLRPSSLSSRFTRLDIGCPTRLIIPSSSTAALGSESAGNVQSLSNIVRSEVRQSVLDLHVADLHEGASAIVTATCGGHNRQIRPDPLPYPVGVRNQHALDEHTFLVNRIAVEVACDARRAFGRDDVPIFGSVVTSGDCYDGSRQILGVSEGNLRTLFYHDHESQIHAFAKGNDRVDAVLVEAGGVSVPELFALVELARDVRLPVLVSLVVGDDGRILDEQSNYDFFDLSRVFRSIAGDFFLGLGLNCNSRKQTHSALERDVGEHILLAYTNQAEICSEDRAVGNFSAAPIISIEEEIEALRSYVLSHSYLRGIGSCCRLERSVDVLRACRDVLSEC